MSKKLGKAAEVDLHLVAEKLFAQQQQPTTVAVAPDVVRNFINLPFFQDPLRTYFDVCKPISSLTERQVSLSKVIRREKPEVPPLKLNSNKELHETFRSEHMSPINLTQKSSQPDKCLSGNAGDKNKQPSNNNKKVRRIKKKSERKATPCRNTESEVIGDNITKIPKGNSVLLELQTADKHALQTMSMINQIRTEIATWQKNPGDNKLLQEKRDKLMAKVLELERTASRVKNLIEASESSRKSVNNSLPPTPHFAPPDVQHNDTKRETVNIGDILVKSLFNSERNLKNDDTPRAKLKSDLQNLTEEIMHELAVCEAASDDGSLDDEENYPVNSPYVTPRDTTPSTEEPGEAAGGKVNGPTEDDSVTKKESNPPTENLSLRRDSQETIMKENDHREESVNMLDGEIKELASKVEELERINEYLRNEEITGLMAKVEELERENRKLKNEEMQALAEKISRLEQDNQQLQNKIEKCETENQRTLMDWEEESKAIADFTEMIEEELEMLKVELTTLQATRVKIEEKMKTDQVPITSQVEQKMETVLCQKMDEIVEKYERSLKEFESSMKKIDKAQNGLEPKDKSSQNFGDCSVIVECSGEKFEKKCIEIEKTVKFCIK